MSEVHSIPRSDEDEKRLPFTEHLRELRTRTVRAVVYVAIAFGLAWAFHEPIFSWLMEPFDNGILGLDSAQHDLLSYRSIMEPIMVYLKLSLAIGGLLAMPFVLLEAWLFIAPGLLASEKRLALPFLLATVICFGGGAAFCRYLVLDPAIHVLLRTAGAGTTPVIMMQDYFSFTTRLLFLFGALFELPVVVSFLSMIGLVTPQMLIRNWRYAIVGAFIVSAIFTPPDPWTQAALAVPMSLLYTVSIGLSWAIYKAKGTKAEPDVEEAA